MKRRSALRRLSALALLAALPAPASAAGAPREGIDYVRLPKPAPQSGPGVEVIEFFSYACPHCKEAEPYVTKWRATLPKDVTFRRVPISFQRAQWAAFQKLYLTLEATGDLQKVHHEVFAALHDQKLPLATEKAVMDWAAKKVADPKKFADTYQSFGIQTKARSGDQAGADFGISGVPAFGVGGRYLIVAKEAKGFEEILQVTNGVIELARKK